jgi:hypothetical protein
MNSLNEYEAQQADEIAAWKSERPSLVMAAFRGLSRPLSRLAAKVVPDTTVHELIEKAGKTSEKRDGEGEIARKAGVQDIRELGNRTLEECDRLAATISSSAQRLAMVEGAVAGIGGVVTETLNIPVLLTATLRSINRIGHCYGYPLDREIDRLFVVGILELATVDDPKRRQLILQQLKSLVEIEQRDSQRENKIGLAGVEAVMLEDVAFGAVPLLGDLSSIMIDYDFVRRVDVTARRVFQERWLKERGKVEEIFPAPVNRRRSSLEGGVDLLAQIFYVGSYGVTFGVTFPLALTAKGVAYFDGPMARGFKNGAVDAAQDVDRILARARARSEPTEPAVEGATARSLSIFPAV